jgi:hypothetical protein
MQYEMRPLVAFVIKTYWVLCDTRYETEEKVDHTNTII